MGHIVIRCLYNTPLIEIQIDPAKLLPNIKQYPLSQSALQVGKPIIKEYKAQGLIIPCTSPCNTSLLPIKNLMVQGRDLFRTPYFHIN